VHGFEKTTGKEAAGFFCGGGFSVLLMDVVFFD